MANDFKGCAIPDPFAPKEEKVKQDFGIRVAKGIIGATEDYVHMRNATIAKNKQFSNGKQPVQPYLDQMGVDGKNALTNIRFKPRPIAPKFKRVIVNGYALRKEKVRLEALSKDIRDRKDKRKSDAMFRKDFAPELSQLQEASGVEIEDKNAFVPDSEEHNDIYYGLNDREREELVLQKSVNFCIRDNDIDQLKVKILTECFEANLFGLYAYTDRTGRFGVDFISSEDCIYSNSERDDFSDIKYAGRRLRLSISQVRSRFKVAKHNEKKLYELAKTMGSSYGNTPPPRDWSHQWQDSFIRPYDNNIVDVAHVWWRCSDDVVVNGFNAEMAYEGYWIKGADFMLQWGACKNILREGEDKERILCPFIFHMVDNDGTMMTKSLLENMIDSIETMDLTILKIKALVAKVRPNGYVIDINGLNNVDLGDGELDPLSIADIRNETGDTYWNSVNEEGEHVPTPPIRDDLASMGSQVQELINTYNWELDNIRNYLGVNEYREGGKVPAKLGLGVLNAQLDSSNTATYSVYMAWAITLKRLARQICVRISDELVFNPHPNKGLLGILGQDNVDLFKERKDIAASTYDVMIDLEMETEQRQQKEQNISTALSTKEITLEDAEYIRNIDDYSMSMRYLAYASKKRKAEAMQEADQMQKNNAAYNQQAAVAAEQERQKTVQLELSMKQEMAKEEGSQSRYKNMESLAYKLIELSQTTGQPINPLYMPIVEKVLNNMALGIDMEQVEKEKQVEQIEAQEAQQAQEEQAMAEQQDQEGMAQQSQGLTEGGVDENGEPLE